MLLTHENEIVMSNKVSKGFEDDFTDQQSQREVSGNIILHEREYSKIQGPRSSTRKLYTPTSEGVDTGQTIDLDCRSVAWMHKTDA